MTVRNNQTNAAEYCGLCSGINGRAQFAAKNHLESDETAAPKKRKGIIGRFLDRLAKANQREFGDGGPCCH